MKFHYLKINDSLLQLAASYSEHPKGISRIGEPPLLKIAKQLESMAKDLNHLTTGFKRLRVDAFTQTDRDVERAEWDVQCAEFSERHKQDEGA